MDVYAENRRVVPELHQDGLTLRPIVRDDADAIVSALSQWRVTQWLINVPFPYSYKEAFNFIDKFAIVEDDFFGLLITEMAS